MAYSEVLILEMLASYLAATQLVGLLVPPLAGTYFWLEAGVYRRRNRTQNRTRFGVRTIPPAGTDFLHGSSYSKVECPDR